MAAWSHSAAPEIYPRFALNRAAAAPFSVIVREQVEGFAGGDDDQEPPQVVAVVELGKAARGHAAKEAVKGVLDDVFLVGGPAAGRLKLLAGQGHELAVVALPERLRGGGVAAFQRRNPTGD